MLAWLAQAFIEWRVGGDLMMFLGALNPAWALELTELHRFITAAWLHGSTLHILGNLLVIILVGVPLEQRLGRGRFVAIYLIGVLGGNMGWALANWESTRFSLGASGAAFGLLGCYLACWPRDEIEFPLILIRKWPVAWVALFKFAHEVLAYGLFSGTSNVAHLAHLTGFIACYVLAKPIAKGGLVPIGTVDSGPSSQGGQDAIHTAMKSKMGDISSDPWNNSEYLLDKAASRTLQRLREEGDEIETRQAWLEQLSEQAMCPECGGEIVISAASGISVLNCSKSPSHLNWP
jgi:membrane associated rhomboid family serine protease